MFDGAVEKALEDVIAKSDLTLDKLLVFVIEAEQNALEEALREIVKPEEKIAFIKAELPTIKTLARAVQRVKE